MENLSDVRAVRLKKLEALKTEGISPFRNDFRISHQFGEIIKNYDAWNETKLESLEDTFAVAGRMVALRSFGKAVRSHLAATPSPENIPEPVWGFQLSRSCASSWRVKFRSRASWAP